MHLSDTQPASTTEVSSIPSSTTRHIWNTTRSTSVPDSPSSLLSTVSEQLSEISSSESPHISPPSSHFHPKFTLTPSISRYLPDTSASLPLSYPKLPIQSPSTQLPSAPLIVMNTPQYIVSPLAQIPMRYMKNAPSLFKGDYHKVTCFIEHYSHLLEVYQVTSDHDKCQGILEYCSQDVEDFIKSCPDFIDPDWNALKEEILMYYDAERMDTRIRTPDLIQFLVDQHQKPMEDLSAWKKYCREY